MQLDILPYTHSTIYCGKISGSYLQYFLRYGLFSPIFGPVRKDRQTESVAYEPTMKFAQVGSKSDVYLVHVAYEPTMKFAQVGSKSDVYLVHCAYAQVG